MRYNLSLEFGPAPIPGRGQAGDDEFAPTGFIAHPYWPEREKVINIRKRSGVDRPMLSDQKRAQALSQYIQSLGMTLVDFEGLEKQASRPFYTWADVLLPEVLNGRDPTEIVISAHEVYGCLAQAASLVSSATRVAKPEHIRTVLHVSDLATGKRAPDGVWERYVTVKAGTGAKLSNQRGFRSNEFIENFSATGSIAFSPDMAEAKKVRRFLDVAGQEIGIGAARKMGWGRFRVTRWEAVS